MDDYYYATITYPSGDKVRVIHKGREPTRHTMKFLGRLGATFEIGEPIPPEVNLDAENAALAVEGARRAGRHPKKDVPGGDGA